MRRREIAGESIEDVLDAEIQGVVIASHVLADGEEQHLFQTGESQLALQRTQFSLGRIRGQSVVRMPVRRLQFKPRPIGRGHGNGDS